MVAEKPSLAQSLAKILSNNQMSTRKGFNGACSIHEYTGQFHGEQVRFKFTSVCGHVMTTDFIGKYNNWDKVDPVNKLFYIECSVHTVNDNVHLMTFFIFVIVDIVVTG